VEGLPALRTVLITRQESLKIRSVYLHVLVAAIGGLLFGFDTAVINGAIVFLKRQFSLNASPLGLSELSVFTEGIYMSQMHLPFRKNEIIPSSLSLRTFPNREAEMAAALNVFWMQVRQVRVAENGD
jgi:hypothetical protein